MRILIAEDEANFLELLESFARNWGYEVTVAHDGSAAWEILQQEDAPHLAILDRTMPGLDGLEICRLVRQQLQDHYTYIILLTSHRQDEDIVTGMEAGADDYITKPIKVNELKVRLTAGKRIVELEDHLLEIQMRLASHAAELEAANQDLENFTYTLGNDLPKYLMAIEDQTSSLESEFCRNGQEVCRTTARSIYQNANRLSRIVNAMHSFLSTRSELHLEPVDLTALAWEEADSFRNAMPSRVLTFHIARGLKGFGDKNMLRVVLNNLFKNAWRHTEMREEGRIEFGTKEFLGETVFFVRDNGRGFDPREAHRLFKPFQKLPGTEQLGGEGLGLTTVARIILRHGGKVWGEGEPGKGATFYFTLAPP